VKVLINRNMQHIFFSVINQLDAQNFCFTISLFYASTCFEHIYTYRCDDTRCCIIQFWPPDDEQMCSKHTEAWNKLIVKQKFCASSWLITEINILRCTVNKTSKNAAHCWIALKCCVWIVYHVCIPAVVNTTVWIPIKMDKIRVSIKTVSKVLLWDYRQHYGNRSGNKDRILREWLRKMLLI